MQEHANEKYTAAWKLSLTVTVDLSLARLTRPPTLRKSTAFPFSCGFFFLPSHHTWNSQSGGNLSWSASASTAASGTYLMALCRSSIWASVREFALTSGYNLAWYRTSSATQLPIPAENACRVTSYEEQCCMQPCISRLHSGKSSQSALNLCQLPHGLSACIKAHEQLIGQAFQLLHLT